MNSAVVDFALQQTRARSFSSRTLRLEWNRHRLRGVQWSNGASKEVNWQCTHQRHVPAMDLAPSRVGLRSDLAPIVGALLGAFAYRTIAKPGRLRPKTRLDPPRSLHRRRLRTPPHGR